MIHTNVILSPVKTIFGDLTLEYQKNIRIFGMEFLSTLIGLMLFTGVNALFAPIGTILEAMIVRWRMSGLLNIYTLVALTSLVRSVVSELLLTLKLAMLLITLVFPIVVTALASVVSENIQNVRNKWRLTA